MEVERVIPLVIECSDGHAVDARFGEAFGDCFWLTSLSSEDKERFLRLTRNFMARAQPGRVDGVKTMAARRTGSSSKSSGSTKKEVAATADAVVNKFLDAKAEKVKPVHLPDQDLVAKVKVDETSDTKTKLSPSDLFSGLQFTTEVNEIKSKGVVIGCADGVANVAWANGCLEAVDATVLCEHSYAEYDFPREKQGLGVASSSGVFRCSDPSRLIPEKPDEHMPDVPTGALQEARREVNDKPTDADHAKKTTVEAKVDDMRSELDAVFNSPRASASVQVISGNSIFNSPVPNASGLDDRTRSARKGGHE
jgi:hypothetical protein